MPCRQQPTKIIPNNWNVVKILRFCQDSLDMFLGWICTSVRNTVGLERNIPTTQPSIHGLMISSRHGCDGRAKISTNFFGALFRKFGFSSFTAYHVRILLSFIALFVLAKGIVTLQLRSKHSCHTQVANTIFSRGVEGADDCMNWRASRSGFPNFEIPRPGAGCLLRSNHITRSSAVSRQSSSMAIKATLGNSQIRKWDAAENIWRSIVTARASPIMPEVSPMVRRQECEHTRNEPKTR